MPPSPVAEVLCSPWATAEDVPAAVRATLDVTDDELNAKLLIASEILWALSGRTWYGGGCEESVILRSQPPPPGTGAWPYSNSWGWCECWSASSWPGHPGAWPGQHYAPVSVRLPRSPITAVTAVTIDGDAFTGYTLRRSGWLERTDGNPWNVCGEATEITYTFGEPPPAGGRDSAVELGVEMVRAALGVDCRLPERVTNVTRQGVSMTVMDPAEFLEKGKVGLPGVDLWLSAVNPKAVAQSAFVWSPDIPTSVRS